uniref:Uncharacterized protein n=1 Tax=Physcomitrium patens TaxID=3218 RepID=A0A2K1IDF0_PHYPA|nr:hypothetical protein PHYPA_029461 [Physcomitrium patens]
MLLNTYSIVFWIINPTLSITLLLQYYYHVLYKMHLSISFFTTN